MSKNELSQLQIVVIGFSKENYGMYLVFNILRFSLPFFSHTFIQCSSLVIHNEYVRHHIATAHVLKPDLVDFVGEFFQA